MNNFSISINLRKDNLPAVNFAKIKEAILGKKYELSLLICADNLAQKINKKHRNKSYIPNTLSFIYSEKSGEIILNARQIEREAKSFGHSVQEHFIFLFIHSLLHLKGFEHSKKMEEAEDKYFKKFSTKRR